MDHAIQRTYGWVWNAPFQWNRALRNHLPTTHTHTVKANMVRKKNLAPGTAYRFRVRARDRIDWNPFLPPAVVKVGGREEHSSCWSSCDCALPFPCADRIRRTAVSNSPPVTHVQTTAPNLQQMAAPRLEGRGDGYVAVAWEPVEGAEK